MPQPVMPKPNAIWSIFTMKCPRCRRGPMFKDNNPYKSFTLSHIFDMYSECPHCLQKYELETGFWYGTGYVSYALACAVSACTFLAWLLIIGVGFDDNRIFGWLIFNIVLLIVLQPYLMRLSRVVYLYFFIRYDKEYKKNSPKIFDY
jgi:hypothetical protein